MFFKNSLNYVNNLLTGMRINSHIWINKYNSSLEFGSLMQPELTRGWKDLISFPTLLLGVINSYSVASMLHLLWCIESNHQQFHKFATSAGQTWASPFTWLRFVKVYKGCLVWDLFLWWHKTFVWYHWLGEHHNTEHWGGITTLKSMTYCNNRSTFWTYIYYKILVQIQWGQECSFSYETAHLTTVCAT